MKNLALLATLMVALTMTALPARLAGADADAAIAALRAALNGQDFDAKHAALRVLADPAVGNDDDVLPLLVAAVWDRQAKDVAIVALRQRTGLVPPVYYGQSHYPAYPSSDRPEDWQEWLMERDHDRETDKAIDDLLQEVGDATAAHAVY
jgi:hypothetical protein